MLLVAMLLAAQADPGEPVLLERRHSIALELAITDGEVTEGGAPIILMTEPEGYRLLREAAWRDELDASPDQRFFRHFDVVTGGLAGAGEDDPAWESALEGSTVEFERGDAGWDVDWAPGERGDDALLAGLLPDGDLSLLAPPEGAGPGETWRVELADAAPLLAPLGELSLGEKERAIWFGGGLSGFTLPPPPPVGRLWFSDLSVSGEARWTETVERDGRRHAIVELELRTRGEVDPGARCEELARESGLAIDVERYALKPGLELEGELEWDLDAWRAERLALSGDAALDLDVLWTVTSSAGDANALVSPQRLVGTVTIEASCVQL